MNNTSFNLQNTLKELKRYLPFQAPLKDFIAQNILRAFQNDPFEAAMDKATTIFGYKVTLTLDEYRSFHRNGKISDVILEKVITERKGKENLTLWKERLLRGSYQMDISPRVGILRKNWKKLYSIDVDLMVHPILFRILCSYLDQGISIWNFPVLHKGFLASMREMEKNTFTSFFQTERAKNFLLEGSCEIEDLLKILVGDESLYSHYLFDQQFAHQGWSGMVATVEDNPNSLIDTKKISLQEIILFELLLEIDTLDNKFGTTWAPLASTLQEEVLPIFAPVERSEMQDVLHLFHEAYEMSYYDQVLAGINLAGELENKCTGSKTFQAMFCMDDRESSIRQHVESFDPCCETFGTPGFFGVEFYYQPEHGKSYTKVCPLPVTPKYLIKEYGGQSIREQDAHFTKHSHSLVTGWLISQTLGFWSAFKLFVSIFRPSISPATTSSFKHMDSLAQLTIENKDLTVRENNLQVGFTIDEMVTRVEGLLKSIGLVNDFAPLVYVVSHGASTVNNPHYAAYDCGACSGRPGSVNARVICHMANHKEVRARLAKLGISIPDGTQFVGALHDTTCDDIAFYDEAAISAENKALHTQNIATFRKGLDMNAKERSRRFESINTKLPASKIHEKIRIRSVSLFEPRPEYTHASNALCFVGPRKLSKKLFLDRRSFMNSFDHRVDPEGLYLSSILNAVAPVGGGINLEYFFSRVDNQKLGAGSKLPHNVMGLFGVANGTDGDLRPGLPSQMIEIHDPIRLMVIAEHYPEVVLEAIKRQANTHEWFKNEWIHLVAVHPTTNQIFWYKDDQFTEYHPVTKHLETVSDLANLIESTNENLPVYLIQ